MATVKKVGVFPVVSRSGILWTLVRPFRVSSSWRQLPGHDVSLYVKDNLPKIMLVAWVSGTQQKTYAARSKRNSWHWNWKQTFFKWLSVNYRSILISVTSNLIYVYIYNQFISIDSNIWYGFIGYNDIYFMLAFAEWIRCSSSSAALLRMSASRRARNFFLISWRRRKVVKWNFPMEKRVDSSGNLLW